VPALDARMQDGSSSPVIEGLLNRRSVLEPGPLLTVSDAVLAANARAAEADLRAARLRAEARATNWLPTLGPQVSLTSLGALVTSLVVEQVLFDNGRKRAERDFAAADVEVAAVVLAQDTNARVYQALELYLSAEAANARAAVNAAAMERMTHFAYVMSERVRGGVSDRADLQIVAQKRDQMQADMTRDRETAAAALAELAAMSASPLAGVGGLSAIAAISPTATPLAVMKAEAEATRAVASARAARAGYLPGATLAAQGGSGGSDAALTIGAPNGFGFGTGASLRAIEAEEAASRARIGQVREDSDRALAALRGQLASLQRQQVETQALAAQAAANYDIFAAQLRAGTRTVPDVVGVFETKVRSERDAAGMRFNVALIELRIAELMGALVDGERI
jgi:adhesin transport system outer membrane protein